MADIFAGEAQLEPLQARGVRQQGASGAYGAAVWGAGADQAPTVQLQTHLADVRSRLTLTQGEDKSSQGRGQLVSFFY